MITKANIEFMAARGYTHICLSVDDFYEDLRRIRRIRRLMTNYRNNSILQVNQILNHITILYNVFEKDTITNILFMELEGFEDILIPFLIQLGFYPKKVMYNHEVIYTNTFNIDAYVTDEITKIVKG